MSEDATEQEFEPLRKQLLDVVPGDAGQILWRTIEDSLSVNKVRWVDCPACNKKRLKVLIPDARAALQATELLLTQLEGRAPIAAGDANGEAGVLVKVVLVGVDGAPSTEDAERWARMLENGETDRLRAQLNEAAAKASEI